MSEEPVAGVTERKKRPYKRRAKPESVTSKSQALAREAGLDDQEERTVQIKSRPRAKAIDQVNGPNYGGLTFRRQALDLARNIVGFTMTGKAPHDVSSLDVVYTGLVVKEFRAIEFANRQTGLDDVGVTLQLELPSDIASKLRKNESFLSHTFDLHSVEWFRGTPLESLIPASTEERMKWIKSMHHRMVQYMNPETQEGAFMTAKIKGKWIASQKTRSKTDFDLKFTPTDECRNINDLGPGDVVTVKISFGSPWLNYRATNEAGQLTGLFGTPITLRALAVTHAERQANKKSSSTPASKKAKTQEKTTEAQEGEEGAAMNDAIIRMAEEADKAFYNVDVDEDDDDD